MGQSHILSVDIENGTPSRDDLGALFQSAYWARFAVDLPEIRPVVVNLHTAVLGRRKPVPIAAFAGTAERAVDVAGAVESRRRVWFAQTGWVETPVLARDRLPIGGAFEGPAIISQFDATTVIEPGQKARTDFHGNLLVDVALM